VQFHTIPMVPVFAIISTLSRLVDIAEELDVTLLVVTDGLRHPMKAAVDEGRKAKASAKMSLISELIAADRSADFNEVQKLRRESCFVRADVLKVAVDFFESRGVEVAGAPFEADFQCVHEENAGSVSAIISSDADLFVLGAKRLVMNLDLSDGACYIVKREEALQSANLGGGRLGDYGVIVLANFMGNDYISRPLGLGHKKALGLALRYVAANESDRDGILKSIESMSWGVDAGSGLCIGYPALFKRVVSLCHYAPVIAKTATLGGGASFDSVLGVHNPTTTPSDSVERTFYFFIVCCFIHYEGPSSTFCYSRVL